MNKVFVLPVLVLAGLLAACGSTPRTDYYILASLAEQATGGAGPSLGIGPLHVPAYLDRPQIVRSDQGIRLDVREYERWAEPVPEGISRVLAVNLAALFDARRVQIYPWSRERRPELALSLSVLQFNTVSDSAVLLADWQLTSTTDGEEIARGLREYRSAIAGSDGAAVTATLSTLLFELCQDIRASYDQAQTPE